MWQASGLRFSNCLSTKFRSNRPKILAELRSFFYQASWAEVYDFLEAVIQLRPQNGDLAKALNLVLARELAAYRIVQGSLSL